MKLTPWFPGSVKPVRDGVYIRKLSRSGPLFYSLFRKGVWYAGVSVGSHHGPQQAASRPFFFSAQQQAKWLGIEKPRSRKGRKPVNT